MEIRIITKINDAVVNIPGTFIEIHPQLFELVYKHTNRQMLSIRYRSLSVVNNREKSSNFGEKRNVIETQKQSETMNSTIVSFKFWFPVNECCLWKRFAKTTAA